MVQGPLGKDCDILLIVEAQGKQKLSVYHVCSLPFLHSNIHFPPFTTAIKLSGWVDVRLVL